MDQCGGNANPGNLFSSKITAFHDRDSLEPRPGNKYNLRRFSAHLEEHLVKEKRVTKFPLVGALVHKALRRREGAQVEKEQITGPEDNQKQQKNNNNDGREPNRMVLPFGLGPDGHHVDAIQSAPAPSAPPAHMMPPTYSRGQTNIYTGVPIIVNPYIDFIVSMGDDRYMIRCERKSVLERSIIYCIRELDLRISSATALDIFKALWFYQGIALTNQHQTVITTQETGQQLARKKATKAKAAAKQLAAAKASQSTENGAEGDGAQQNLIPNPNPFTTEDYGVALLHNTLQLIDMHAELQLSMPEISDLRFEELETLVKRDTLQLRSEVTLFECLATWSLAECARKHIDATPENRRTVLGPLCLTPRYLQMTASEFRRCCERLELLPHTEISLITDALEGKKLKNLTDQQAELLEKFRQPRAEYARMPVHLSDRSSPKNYPKKMRLAHEGRPTEDGCWEKSDGEEEEADDEEDGDEEEDEDGSDEGNGNGNGGGRNRTRDDGG
ncbi:GM14792 [Drosophila sechellia]|uniref:GM14792 n=1 Tax=Drosophila sechellia TaxID=7238 RepID=B4HUV9_DROSE|nr:GM14792 [Drosophila sechellia]